MLVQKLGLFARSPNLLIWLYIKKIKQNAKDLAWCSTETNYLSSALNTIYLTLATIKHLNMKLFKLTLLLILTLASCSSDDDGNQNIPIIGKWKQISEIEAGFDFTNECTPLNVVEFKTDGTGTNISYSSSETQGNFECIFDGENEFQWSIDRNKIIGSFISEGQRIENESVFKIENNTLTIDSDEGTDSLITKYERL